MSDAVLPDLKTILIDWLNENHNKGGKWNEAHGWILNGSGVWFTIYGTTIRAWPNGFPDSALGNKPGLIVEAADPECFAKISAIL